MVRLISFCRLALLHLGRHAITPALRHAAHKPPTMFISTPDYERGHALSFEAMAGS